MWTDVDGNEIKMTNNKTRWNIRRVWVSWTRDTTVVGGEVYPRISPYDPYMLPYSILGRNITWVSLKTFTKLKLSRGQLRLKYSQ